MRRIGVALVALCVVGALLPAAAKPVGHAFEPAIAGTTDVSTQAFDARGHSTPPLLPALRAADRLRSEVSDAQVTWDTTLGTAKLVFSTAGYLTKAARGSATAVARSWLEAHQGLFGLNASAIRSASVTRDAVLPGTNMHALVFRVRYGSIPTYSGGTVGVNVMPDGRVLSVWGSTGPTGTLDSKPRVSAATALKSVAQKLGAKLTLQPMGQRKSGDRLAIFGAGGLFQTHNVRLVAFPTSTGPVLGWRVFLAKGGEEMISSIVDATTGQILFLNNEVKHAEGKVYENYPGAAGGGTQKVVSFDGDPAASPNGWLGLTLPTGQTVQSITTLGNNAFAWTDWAWPKLAPGGLILALIQANTFPELAPISPTGSFNYDYNNEWSKSCEPIEIPRVAGRGIPVKGNTIESPAYIQDRDPATTNLFYFANKYHDLMYQLGFTEAMGNYQQSNFGKGGKELDGVRVGAQLGVLNNQVDNAFFFPAADGGEPTSFINPSDPTTIKNYIVAFSGMFLWRPVPGFEAGCSDGATDAHVVWHELTHGTTTRVAGGPDDSDSLTQTQSGAMGEAWSDWFAMHLLRYLGFEKGATFAPYVTGNKQTGIRHFKLDANPLTYGDLGFGRHGPEVHDDGEIWSATLWDIQTALIAKYGEKGGLDRAGHLVFDALTVAGMANPSMLDQRNGILKADLARYKGEDAALLWRVFARRGMGFAAKTLDAQDPSPIPAFDVPGSGNATLSGLVTDGDGGVLKGVKVIIGLGEGNPSGVVRTDALGKFSFPLQPGVYNVTLAAAGYGLQSLGRVKIGSGINHLNGELLKNLTSLGYGAKVVSGLPEGETGLALLDDHEFSGQILTVGTPVVVKLVGGDKAVLVRRINVSQEPAGGPATASITKYKVELSLDGKTWTEALVGGVRRNKPRPIAPDWGPVRKILKTGVLARFARFTAIDTVGGAPAGGGDWTGIVGDLQVLGSSPGAAALKVGGEPDFVENATIALSNAGGGGGGADASVTQLIWQNTCMLPQEPIQGLDAWIVELPDGYGDGLHKIALKNSGGQATDLDIYFWNADCTAQVGSVASPLANEAGPISPGSKWVLIVLFAGTTDGFEVRASTTLERIIAPVKVAGVKITRPAPAPKPAPGSLPATGVGDAAPAGLALVMAAAVAAVWRRRRA